MKSPLKPIVRKVKTSSGTKQTDPRTQPVFTGKIELIPKLKP